MSPLPLHVESEGGGDGPPIVLVHGFGACNHFWRHWVPGLTENHPVHRVELTGFGAAPTPRRADYSPPAQAERLVAFLDGLEGGPPVLVGHSLGAAVVLLAALRLLDREVTPMEDADRTTSRRPRALRGLVVISGAVYPQRLPPFLTLARIPVAGELLLFLPPPRWALRLGIRGIVHDRSTVSESQVEGYRRPLESRERRRAILRAARQIRPEVGLEVSPRYPEIEIPTLILWGERDRIVPPEVAHRLADAMPHATKVLLPEVGHLPPEEAPEVTLEIMRGFLSGLPAP